MQERRAHDRRAVGFRARILRPQTQSIQVTSISASGLFFLCPPNATNLGKLMVFELELGGGFPPCIVPGWAIRQGLGAGHANGNGIGIKFLAVQPHLENDLAHLA